MFYVFPVLRFMEILFLSKQCYNVRGQINIQFS